MGREPLQLQWLLQSTESSWLGVDGSKLYPIATGEIAGKVRLKQDAWNRVQLTLNEDKQVAVELNGELIAQVMLPEEVTPEFGLAVNQSIACSGPRCRAIRTMA